MSETVTDLLGGPVGAAVRVAAGVLCAGLVFWVVTGVQFTVEERRRQRLVVRVLLGAGCLAVLVPVVVDPVGALEWWRATLTSLGGRFTS